MVPILVRQGDTDTICNNLGSLVERVVSFCNLTNDHWQVNLHKVYGFCGYPKGCNKRKDVMDRENQIRYCRQKDDCPCKNPFNKETKILTTQEVIK